MTSRYQILNKCTVEFRWLELERTVKMCSSHRGPVILEREKSDSDPGVPGQFHYALITDAQYQGPLS